MKKIWGILLVLLLVLLVSACNGTGGSQDAPVGETSPHPASTGSELTEKITTMYLYIGENRCEVTLERNRTADALVALLKQEDIVYTAEDYGGFEKVGVIGYTLPADDTRITAESGDVILYEGDRIVLFYGSNTWSYTRIGRIRGHTLAEYPALLGAGQGSIQVRMSLK